VNSRKAERGQPISEVENAPPGFVPAACSQGNTPRTREVWSVPARKPVESDKPTQGEEDAKALQKSY
jgi:hypothetical protein